MSRRYLGILFVITLVGALSAFAAMGFGFGGFDDDTNEPCFMNDPFCAGEDQDGHATTCKKCVEAGNNSSVCTFDSTANYAECKLEQLSNGTFACSTGGKTCQ